MTIINDIANAFIEKPDNANDEVALRKAMSVYRDIEAHIEQRCIRAIHEYNTVLVEMLETLTDTYDEVKQRVRPYPDSDMYDIDIMNIEKDYVEIEFRYDSSVTQIPVAWLVNGSWEVAVEETARKRIEGAIGLVNRKTEAKRKKLEDRRAKLQKQLEDVDKSLGDL